MIVLKKIQFKIRIKMDFIKNKSNLIFMMNSINKKIQDNKVVECL